MISITFPLNLDILKALRGQIGGLDYRTLGTPHSPYSPLYYAVFFWLHLTNFIWLQQVVDDGEAVVPGTDSVFLVSDSSDEDFETREARLEQQEETDDESESPEVQVG